MARTTIETPVLIAGGGPVGLALALDLNYQGTPSIVVEQAADTGTQPLAKAGTFNERTIEFCRRWGLVEQIAAGFPDDLPRDTVYCTALNGEYLGRSVVASARERGIPPISPEMMRRCPQYTGRCGQGRRILADPLRQPHRKLCPGRRWRHLAAVRRVDRRTLYCALAVPSRL